MSRTLDQSQRPGHPAPTRAEGESQSIKPGVRIDGPHQQTAPNPTACPMCESEQIRQVTRIATDRLVFDWQATFDMDVAGELRGVEEISRYACSNCKVEFFWPMQLDGSGKFYEELQKFDWYYMPDKWEHQETFQIMPAGSKVLEIGCAEGAFLINARTRRGAEVFGLEINEEAARIAASHDIEVSCEPLHEFARQRSSQFDMVCSYQVLEHVNDPKTFIESSLRVLRPGGKLVIGVPNEDSFLKHQWTLLNMPPHHLTLWTPNSFQRIADLYGLKLTGIHREPLAEYHVDGYVDSWAKYCKPRSFINRLTWGRKGRNLRKALLRMGLRKFATGQTLLAVLEKPHENQI